MSTKANSLSLISGFLVKKFLHIDNDIEYHLESLQPIIKHYKEIKDLKSKLGEDFRNTMKIFATCLQFMKRTKSNTHVKILEPRISTLWFKIIFI